MEKKVKKRYYWTIEFFADESNPDNWFVDEIYCDTCGYLLNDIFRVTIGGHPAKYCPGCGGFIEGEVNPYPPIKEAD